LIVGLSNFLISFTVFRLLLMGPGDFKWKVAGCQLVSYGVGIAWSYFLNRRFTFQCQQPMGPQVRRFVFLQVSLALISSALIEYLVQSWQVYPTMAWFLVMAGVTVVNYLFCRFWVYR